MISKILIPTDGSERSGKAIGTAMALAKALGASVVGCAAIPPYPYTVLGGVSADEEAQYLGAASARATANLAAIERAARENGIPCVTEIQENAHPHRAILQSAQTHDCGLIVMASHGRAGMAAMVLGSETQKVLTLTDRPVLVVR
jgi:nucleotide-binding universal stress UspA family protein